MAILFDIDAVLEEMKGGRPPYKCPLCGKSYKTYSGIAGHLVNCTEGQDSKQELDEDEKPVGLPQSRYQ